MTNPLTRRLRPERACEVAAVEAAGALPDACIIADLIERATKRAWLDGAETGRREILDELAEKKVYDMA